VFCLLFAEVLDHERGSAQITIESTVQFWQRPVKLARGRCFIGVLMRIVKRQNSPKALTDKTSQYGIIFNVVKV